MFSFVVDSGVVGGKAYGSPLRSPMNGSDFGPQLAIDNDYFPYVLQCFVSDWVWDTEADGPWWAVDLGDAYMIDGINIVNIAPGRDY